MSIEIILIAAMVSSIIVVIAAYAYTLYKGANEIYTPSKHCHVRQRYFIEEKGRFRRIERVQTKCGTFDGLTDEYVIELPPNGVIIENKENI